MIFIDIVCTSTPFVVVLCWSPKEYLKVYLFLSSFFIHFFLQASLLYSLCCALCYCSFAPLPLRLCYYYYCLLALLSLRYNLLTIAVCQLLRHTVTYASWRTHFPRPRTPSPSLTMLNCPDPDSARCLQDSQRNARREPVQCAARTTVDFNALQNRACRSNLRPAR